MMNMDKGETVELEYETTHGNNARLVGTVKSVNSRTSYFGNERKFGTANIVDGEGNEYLVQHTGAVRKVNGSKKRTVGYKAQKA